MGEPSPSLGRMRRMDRSELTLHLQRLREHADSVEQRIQMRRAQPDFPPAEMKKLTQLHERLLALIEEGRRLYRSRA